MKKHPAFFITAFLAATLAAMALVACTNSDDILYDESESLFVDISVEMAASFDSSSTRIKADTVSTDDTLIFIANILPSKSIKLKRYFWTLDGKPYLFDFSFRSSIDTPGYHELAFVLETTFGDTLSDTLRLWVSSPPILRDSVMFPAAGSQGIPTSGGVTFAWDAYDPDSLARLNYRIVIDKLVDTVISEPHFTYWGNLAPLRHYNWWVEAINEFGFVSKNRLQGDFYTKGENNESGISGIIGTSIKETNQVSPLLNILFDTFDENDSLIRIDSVSGKTPLSFAIAPLKPGLYTIRPRIPLYPEFFTESVTKTLFNGEVLELDTLWMQDTTAPKIDILLDGDVSQTDTIDFADTLKFLITDFGSPANGKTFSAYLESTPLVEKQSQGDTFTVVLPASARSWSPRLLSIVATDASKNKSVRKYTIAPSESWIKTNSDIAITTSDAIQMFIIDDNPYGYTLDSCTFEINGKHTLSARAMPGTPCKIIVATSYLTKRKNTIRSIARYTNGITLWKRWQITNNTGVTND